MLELKDVSIKYSLQKEWLLQEINLLIQPQSCTGLIGSNGSGKSTIASSIIGIIPFINKGFIQGDILFNYQPINSLGIDERLSKFSYIFQDIESQVLFGNVSNIIGLNEKTSNRVKIEELVYFFNIQHLLNREPKTLSSGELQRVLLVSSMRNNPILLIYDEVTSVLDPILKSTFSQFIEKIMNNGKSILLLGQRKELISPYTNNILKIENKKIVNDRFQNTGEKVTAERFYFPVIQEADINIDLIKFERKNENKFTLEIRDLKISHGQNIAILGLNGSGKTTFLDILNGLIKPQKLLIKVNDNSLNHPLQKSLIWFVECIPHNPYNQISGSTINEELLYKIADNQLKNSLLNSFEFLKAEEDPLDLSFGQLRLLCFLSSIISKKPILTFDEPEFGIDSENLQFIKDYYSINRKEKQRTILYATHDLDFAYETADRILVFKEGRIISDVLTKEIKNIEPWFRSIVT